jgi:hypothetical protein
LEQAQDVKCLGPDRHYFLRIGCLGPHNNGTTFTAKDQAKRYLFGDMIYEKGWQPKRMRTARQQNEFACTTSLDLAIYLVKKNQDNYQNKKMDDDHDDDDDDDDEDKPKEHSVIESSTPSKIIALTAAALSPPPDDNIIMVVGAGTSTTTRTGTTATDNCIIISS